MLDCHNFAIAQWFECNIMMGSAALVLSSILVTASVCFGGFGSNCFGLDSCDLGLTDGFVKTVA